LPITKKSQGQRRGRVRSLARRCPCCDKHLRIVLRKRRNIADCVIKGRCFRCGYRLSWVLMSGRPQAQLSGANMRVTNVRVYPTIQGTLRGYADVTFDNSLCVREFRLLHTPKGYVLRMPNVRKPDGRSRVASALNDKTIKMIQDAVIAEYERIIGPPIRSRKRTWRHTWLVRARA
jgi:DNA-binding cell septation regulator SpoVG